MDRVLIGPHANSYFETGLFVSKSGSNVSDPETAIAGNLTFDSTNFIDGTLEVIQEGQFTLQCKREVVPANFPSGIIFLLLKKFFLANLNILHYQNFF